MMERHPQFNRILLVLVVMICATHGRVVQTMFSLIETGQSIVGQIVDKVTTSSVQICSLR